MAPFFYPQVLNDSQMAIGYAERATKRAKRVGQIYVMMLSSMEEAKEILERSKLLHSKHILERTMWFAVTAGEWRNQ